MNQKRLRIQHILIQPVLVWDDGEELTPAPEVQAITRTFSTAGAAIADFPRMVAEAEANLLAQEAESAKAQPPTDDT